jgi:hypothetical protein
MLEEMGAWQAPVAGAGQFRSAPNPSEWVSQLAIPRRVAPQQSPLPLHQSPTIIAQFRSSEATKPATQTRYGHAVQVALLVPIADGSVISTLRAG